MKKFVLICLALLMMLTAFACTQEPQKNEETAATEKTAAPEEPVAPEKSAAPEEPVKVAALAGPTGMGLAYMMQDMKDKYNVELFTAPDQVTAKIVNGEIDISAVPINLASVLYNKTNGGVKVIAVNTLGVLYFLENGNSVQSIADLAGKTIYATGQGSTPEYILNYLLAANGLTDSVQVEYIADNTELIAKLADGTVQIALLPEPHVSVATAKSSDVRIALKVNDLWNEKNDTQLVQGVYVVRTEYLESHKDQVDAFISDAEASALKVVSAEDAAKVIVEQGIIPKEPIAKKAIPNCNITLVKGAEMKAYVSAMLKVLFDANPKSVGGNLPDDAFYYAADPS